MAEPVPAGCEVLTGRRAMIHSRGFDDMRWRSLSFGRVIKIGDLDGAE